MHPRREAGVLPHRAPRAAARRPPRQDRAATAHAVGVADRVKLALSEGALLKESRAVTPRRRRAAARRALARATPPRRGRARTRLLEIECDFSDDYLIGHAKRVGLAGEQTPRDTLERLLPTIRHDITHESDRIRDSDFEYLTRIRESRTPEQNAPALAEFLSVSEEVAQDIASLPHLFTD